MDWLIFILEIAFIMPMLTRVLARETPETSLVGELAMSLQAPGLLVHEIGLLLVWIGVAIPLWSSGIERSVTWQGVLGASLHGVATLLMFWSFAVLQSWRLLPKIEVGHELCIAGPYQFVRHPVYAAFDALGIGAAIWVPNAMVIPGCLLLVVGGELRARAEERALVEAFGERYEEYRRRVPRLIPGLY